MIDYKQMAADALAEHWNRSLNEGESVSASMRDLAAKLRSGGCFFNLAEESNQISATSNTQTQPITDEAVSTSAVRFYNYKWEPVAAELKTQLFAKLGGVVDDKYPLSETTTRADVCNLDWYDQYQLLRFTNSEWGNQKLNLYYLLGPETELLRLAGTSPPIHETNAKAPIKLNSENVVSYLIFFCFFVRAEGDPFYVLEFMDDPIIEEIKDFTAGNTLLETTFSIIEGNVKPVVLTNIEEGKFYCESVILYSNALFISRFAVYLNGMIEMIEDEPLAADMPFRIDAPLA